MIRPLTLRLSRVAVLLALSYVSITAGAQDITRIVGTRPDTPFSEAVTVPPGYATYYISGTSASVVNPSAPAGSPQRLGDTQTQTASTLANLKKTLDKLGLTFGDVVQAHVFLVADPANQGHMDFAGLNRAWLKEFGTASQPNRPARSAFQVAALPSPGALVEIELIAAKKP